MKFLRLPIGFLAWIIMFSYACSTSKKTGRQSPNDFLSDIDTNFVSAAAQYKLMMKNLPAGRFPRNFDPVGNKFQTSGSDWWCSGFYPGTLLYLFDQTRDSSLYREAIRVLDLLEKEKNNRGTHDLGFMMYCSFGNAESRNPGTKYEDILLTSARSLSSRFNAKVGCIRSWNSAPADFLVIIDNMMNLELLFWATKFSGDSAFYKIARTHANTTMQNHFRSDYSSYHLLNYDSLTGLVKQKKTAQGYADESSWARGQAWGLYGYVVMYRETKDSKYLAQANNIAKFLLHHPNLPADKIPYWDFNAPGIPNALRDASAGAIMASALLELSNYADRNDAHEYVQSAEIMLRSLSAFPYKASPGTNGGFILQHSVGHFPQQSEMNVGITYADYYYIEALTRYKAIKSHADAF